MNIVRIALFAAAGFMTAQAFIISSMAKRNLQNKEIINLQMSAVSELKKDLHAIEGFMCNHNWHLINEYYQAQKAFYNATKDEDRTMEFLLIATSE